MTHQAKGIVQTEDPSTQGGKSFTVVPREPEREVVVRPPLIIPSRDGKQNMRGTKYSDWFTFNSFDFYNKKYADTIIGFSSEQGDTINVTRSLFDQLKDKDEIAFTTARSKKQLKRLSKKGYDFVYLQKKGYLFYDGNGTEKNWGNRYEGGLLAILQGNPKLTVNDFVVWDWPVGVT